MIAHTLGNPFDIQKVIIYKENNLFLIEDCADVWRKIQMQKVGTFGNIATTSFYPAHHIQPVGWSSYDKQQFTKIYHRVIQDWGRDCCDPGVEYLLQKI